MKPRPTGMMRFIACHAKLPELEDSVSEVAQARPGWHAIDENDEWSDVGKIKIEVIKKQSRRVKKGDIIRVMGMRATVLDVTDEDVVVAETHMGTIVTTKIEWD